MTFNRVNEHMLRCILHENEISQMGYKLSELFKNQELAENFLKDIIVKANEAGFPLNENYKAIQSTMLPDHKIVLNIMELNMEEPINEWIQNSLNVYEAVNEIGPEQLEELLNMTGPDKIQQFQEYMAELQNMKEEVSGTSEKILPDKEALSNKDEPQDKSEANTYLLWFQSLDETERFCKEAAAVLPGRLYKSKRKYGMLIDGSGMESAALRSFLLQANEYTIEMRKAYNTSAYLEEHAEVIIKENPIEVLQKL